MERVGEGVGVYFQVCPRNEIEQCPLRKLTRMIISPICFPNLNCQKFVEIGFLITEARLFLLVSKNFT